MSHGDDGFEEADDAELPAESEFVRTLDGVELYRKGEAVYTDTWLFDGPVWELDELRLVFIERPQWGAFSFAELESLVRYPGLEAAFFADEPLPSPPTPDARP